MLLQLHQNDKPRVVLNKVSLHRIVECLPVLLPLQAAKGKGLGKVPVVISMVISSLFHEYVLAVGLKYSIPFLSVEFVVFGGE